MSETRGAVEKYLHRSSVRGRVQRTTGACELQKAGMAQKSICKDKTFVPFLDAKTTQLLKEAFDEGLLLKDRAKAMENAVETVTEYVEGVKNLGNHGPCACEGMRVLINKTDEKGHELNGRSGIVRKEYEGGYKWAVVELENDDGTVSGETVEIEEVNLQSAGKVFTVEDWIVTKHRSAINGK